MRYPHPPRHRHPPRHVHHPPSRGELENNPDQYGSVIARIDCLLGGDSVDPTGLWHLSVGTQTARQTGSGFVNVPIGEEGGRIRTVGLCNDRPAP